MLNEYSITTEECLKGLYATDLQKKYDTALFKVGDDRDIAALRKVDAIEKDLRIAKDFIAKVKKYGSDLSVPQKKWAISIIQRNCTPEILKRLDLYEEPKSAEHEEEIVEEKSAKITFELADLESKLRELLEFKDCEDDVYEQGHISDKIDSTIFRINQLKQDLLRTNMPSDAMLRTALHELKPYFVCEIDDLNNFFNKTDRYPKFIDWSRNIAIQFLSNYREQISPNLLAKIKLLLPSDADRDEFFLKFTPKFVSFLVHVAKYAVGSSIIFPDKAIDEFLRTDGRGPHASSTTKIGAETNKWKKIVESVYKKLNKAAQADKLSTLGDYVSSPNTYNETEISEMVLKPTEFSYEEKRTALECIQILAEECDYAHEKDFVGFNKIDTVAGHEMAMLSEIPDDEMPRAVFWCRKYRRQLPTDKLEILGIGSKKTPTEKKSRKELKEELSEIKQELSTSYLARYFKSCLL